MEDLNGKRQHKIIISDRGNTLITGVLNVNSFDEKEVILETERGTLTFRGEDLHIGRLTLEKGEVDMEGRIDSLVYSHALTGTGKDSSFFTRMFR